MRAMSVSSTAGWGASVLCLALLAAGCANTPGNGAAHVADADQAAAPAQAETLGLATGAGRQTGESTANMAATLGAPAFSTPTPAPGAVSANPPPAIEGTPQPELLPPPPRQAQAEPADTPAAAPTTAPTPAPTPAPTQQAAAAPAVDAAAGRQLFNDWSCGACHVLADAGATGQIGPALDGNSRMTAASATRIISAGQGAMPGFGGQLTDEEIATLSAYIMQVKR